MDNFYDWKPQYTNVFVTVISVSIGFATYWFLALSEKIKSLFFKKYDKKNAWVAYVFYQKMMGVVFMGLIPGIILLSISDYTLADLGIRFGNYKESLIYIAIMGTLIFIINFFVSKNPFNLAMYPQMRINEWSKKSIIINSIAWAAYLFMYEFMYRGLLLIVCYHSFGFWPAVAINLSFYSATHIAKGLSETIGTFPYGLLLCFVTISTGSIAVAFVTHLILALTNDYFSVYHNPEMKYV
jgi:membrane protease YdiL (CAAX protease family)